MGPTWVLSAPDGPHVGPMNLAMRDIAFEMNTSWPLLQSNDVSCRFFLLCRPQEIPAIRQWLPLSTPPGQHVRALYAHGASHDDDGDGQPHGTASGWIRHQRQARSCPGGPHPQVGSLLWLLLISPSRLLVIYLECVGWEPHPQIGSSLWLPAISLSRLTAIYPEWVVGRLTHK